ncbi:MAG: amidase [Betaproteobacteria bacterium]|nr:amidase [Betaproteobacteria bacterium]
MTPLHRLTATEIVAAVSRGATSAEAVARACLDRIAEREPHVKAWQYWDPDQVLAQARVLDHAARSGPLAGVPFGIKDIIDTADMPTEYGSPIYHGHRPKRDAACVALSRKAGGVLLGKTVTTEFANFHPGKTHNPLDPARTPGGSSSGSAAAVADFMVPLAIGTQTTASTIRPASYCGIFGYRPSFGDLRCTGVMEASGSLDTIGLFSRSIADIALYRDVLAGTEPRAIESGASVPRIGFCRSHLWPKVESGYQAQLEEAAMRLARAGAPVRDIELPADFDRIADLHLAISSYEFARGFTWEIENHWEEISQTLRKGRLTAGLACGVERYREAQAVASRLRTAMEPIFADCDLLMTAAVTGEAPLGLHATGDASMCYIWTILHVPAMSLPVFNGPNGMPIGLQLIAAPGADRQLFAAADWVFRNLG